MANPFLAPDAYINQQARTDQALKGLGEVLKQKRFEDEAEKAFGANRPAQGAPIEEGVPEYTRDQSLLKGMNPDVPVGIASLEQIERQKAIAGNQQRKPSRSSFAGDPDPRAIMKLWAKYPEKADQISKMVEYKDAETKRVVQGVIMNAWSNPENLEETLVQGIEQVRSMGGTPTYLAQALQMYRKDPARAIGYLKMVGATLVPESYEAAFGDGDTGGSKFTDIKTTSDGRLMGINPETGRYEIMETPARVSQNKGTTVNIDSKGQTKEEEEVGKFQGTTYNNIQQAGINANKQIATLNRLEKLSEDAFSGSLAGVKKAFAGVFSEMGIDSEGLDATQTFEALSNSLVLDKAQSMSGALSDRDVSFLESTAPSLKQTASGRKKLIQIMREMAQIEKQYARDAAQFRRERGRFNQIEFEDWVREKRGDEDKLAKYFAGTEFDQSEQSAPQKPQVRSLIKEDDEAREWLRKNPNHPDAPSVRASLGEG